jgi:hypothetical protein
VKEDVRVLKHSREVKSLFQVTCADQSIIRYLLRSSETRLFTHVSFVPNVRFVHRTSDWDKFDGNEIDINYVQQPYAPRIPNPPN